MRWHGTEHDRYCHGDSFGDGQIHRAGFRDTEEVEMTINVLPELTTSPENEAIIAHFTQRTLTFGMIVTGLYPARHATKVSPARGA